MQSIFEIWFKLHEVSANYECLTIKRVTRDQALTAACDAWDRLESAGFCMISMRPAKKPELAKAV